MAALSTQQTILVDALASACVVLLNIALKENSVGGNNPTQTSMNELQLIKTSLASIHSARAQVIAGN